MKGFVFTRTNVGVFARLSSCVFSSFMRNGIAASGSAIEMRVDATRVPYDLL
jgi:hypothetical protein